MLIAISEFASNNTSNMWNRKSVLSSYDKYKLCLRCKAPNDKVTGKETELQEGTVAVGSTSSRTRSPRPSPRDWEHAAKKNALSQLRALYADSSGESSPELSDENGDANERCDEKRTKTCEVSRIEISGEIKERKGPSKQEGQSKKKLKEADHQKYHGYSVGQLLSQLRSEDAARQSRPKKNNAQRNHATTGTNVDCLPSKLQGPCRELQIHQHDRPNISRDDQPDERNAGTKGTTDVLLPKESLVVDHKGSCSGQSKPKQEGGVVETRKDESLLFLKDTNDKCESLVSSINTKVMPMVGNVEQLVTSGKAVVTPLLEDSQTWHLAGQLLSGQTGRSGHEGKEKPVGTDENQPSTHQQESPLPPLSQAEIKDDDSSKKDQLSAEENLLNNKDRAEDIPCRQEAEKTESECKSSFKGSEEQVQLDKDPSEQEDCHTDLQETENVREMTDIVLSKSRQAKFNEKQNVDEVPCPQSYSEAPQVTEKDLCSQALKNRVDKEIENVKLGLAVVNPEIGKKFSGSILLKEEVQFDGGRQELGDLENHWKVTKTEQASIIDEGEKSKRGSEIAPVKEVDQLQEMQEGMLLEECSILTDHNATLGSSCKISHDLKDDEVLLQDSNQITQEKLTETQVQCKSNKEDVLSTEGTGNCAFGAAMGGLYSISHFPQSSKDTEMPMDDRLQESKTVEVPVGDDVDENTKVTDKTFQDSNFKFIASTSICPSQSVCHQSFLEKPQNEVIAHSLKSNDDPDQKKRSLHEAQDDCKSKFSLSAGLVSNKGSDVSLDICTLAMSSVENISENKSDVHVLLPIHHETEEQSVAESGVKLEETSSTDLSRKPTCISADLAALSSDHETSSAQDKGHPVMDSCNSGTVECTLEPKNEVGDSITDSADASCSYINLPSVGSSAVDDEISGISQESDQNLDGSLVGLNEALDLEFSSHSPSPTTSRDLNIRLSSVVSVDCASIMKPEKSMNAVLKDMCDDVEQDVPKHLNRSLDSDDDSKVSRSASPCAASDELGKEATSDPIQEVLTSEERKAISVDVNTPLSSHSPRDGERPVTEQTDAVPESATLLSRVIDKDPDGNTLLETSLGTDEASQQDCRALGIEPQRECLSPSHFGEESTENDDMISLVCDTEDLMSNLDDLLQDSNLQLNKQSPSSDEKESVDETSASTSTKDPNATSPPVPYRSSRTESSRSPQRTRVSTRNESRPPWESKQGCKISVHSRNGNQRFVCKKQDSYRGVVERSPKRESGSNRSTSQRLPLRQRLASHKSTNTSPNVALRQMMRNGPAIQHSGILQKQLQQKQQLQQQQQELQRQLQSQLPPALQLRLGLVKSQGIQQPIQSTSDDVAIVCQRQQAMIEKILQLYQKQRESNVVMEKQKDIIRHYQRAFLIAKKGGPLSMQQMSEGGNLRQSSSPRPRSPSPGTVFDPERKVGRKWPLPGDTREEQRFVNHPEAKRMKLNHGQQRLDEHLDEQFQRHPDEQLRRHPDEQLRRHPDEQLRRHPDEQLRRHPDEEHLQRHVEHRIINLKGNGDRSGPDAECNIPQGRHLGNTRFQRAGGMLISVPTTGQDAEEHQERRCIIRRSAPIYPGTRNRPNRTADDGFQPIWESHDEEVRGGRPRSPSLRSDRPRQASPMIFFEQHDGDFNMDTRSSLMVQREVPDQGLPDHTGHASRREVASPVMAYQERRAPSTRQSNWGSFRITERDSGAGVIVDYCHTSLNRDYPQAEKADVQERRESPPFVDPRMQHCSSPMENHPPDPRVCFPRSQNTLRGPLHPPIVDIQGTCRAPMHPPCRAPLRPSFIDSRGAYRASHHPDVQVPHRAPPRPSVVAISQHWVAQNFQGIPDTLQRLPHPHGHGTLESQMHSRVEYQQEHGRQYEEDFETGFGSEWDNGFYG